jgi:hypothetical protein
MQGVTIDGVKISDRGGNQNPRPANPFLIRENGIEGSVFSEFAACNFILQSGLSR